MSDQTSEQLNTPNGGTSPGEETVTDEGAAAAAAPAGQAAPGPHPHEAADIGYQAGLAAKADDPMEGYRDEDG